MSLPVILDVDPGVDDALAILLALRSPEVDLTGITTVCGNVAIEQASTNVLRVLELMDRTDIPLYAGADRPLKGKQVYAGYVHGKTGLGEASLPPPSATANSDAVGYLVESISSRPQELTVVALGPLTNLALAEAREPGIFSKTRGVIIMGGALFVPGNVTPVAEFNFFVDPHAAHQVLQLDANLTLVPLDVTRKVVLSEHTVRAAARKNHTPAVNFCEAAVRTAVEHAAKSTGVRGICLHDPLAMGVAIDKKICGFEKVWVSVETNGRLTSGQVVTDRRQLAADKRPVGHPVKCATGVGADEFLEMFTQRVLGLGR